MIRRVEPLASSFYVGFHLQGSQRVRHFSAREIVLVYIYICLSNFDEPRKFLLFFVAAIEPPYDHALLSGVESINIQKLRTPSYQNRCI